MNPFRDVTLRLTSPLLGALLLPLTAIAQAPTAYTHARILPGGSPALTDATLIVSGGKVRAIGGADLAIPEGSTVIDCRGKTITPGLIDAAFAGGVPNNDRNEQSEEVTPHLRILDTLDPDDKALARARRGGVTAVHVMPGTMNVIGGLGCVVKTHGATPGEMVLDEAASLRIVLGSEPSLQNRPIRGGSVDSIYYRRPTSRMGVIWAVRKAFLDAQSQETLGAPGANSDPGIEVLRQVLQGKLTAVTTARSEQDLRTALRIAQEFGYQTVVDEAQDAYLVADELADAAVTVMLSAPSADAVAGLGARDGASPRSGTARLLAAKGVDFVITTGTNGRALPLIREAMFAHRFGVSPQQALDAITIRPAKLLGIDDRTGSLAPGKDADFVIWSHDPLDPAATAESVHIDGNPVSQLR